MKERAEQIQRIQEQHPAVIEHMKTFMSGVTERSLNTLNDPQEVHQAIMSFLNGLAQWPHLIEFRGKTFDEYSPEFKNQVGNFLYFFGLKNFSVWSAEAVSDESKESVFERATQINLQNFIEAWSRKHGGQFPEPNWDELQAMHDAVQPPDMRSLYGAMYYGAQTAAIQVFLDDNIPPEVTATNTPA